MILRYWGVAIALASLFFASGAGAQSNRTYSAPIGDPTETAYPSSPTFPRYRDDRRRPRQAYPGPDYFVPYAAPARPRREREEPATYPVEMTPPPVVNNPFGNIFRRRPDPAAGTQAQEQQPANPRAGSSETEQAPAAPAERQPRRAPSADVRPPADISTSAGTPADSFPGDRTGSLMARPVNRAPSADVQPSADISTTAGTPADSFPGDRAGSFVARPVERAPLPVVSAPAAALPRENNWTSPFQMGAAPSTAPGVVPQRPPAVIMHDGSRSYASLPPDDRPEEGEPQELPPQFKRQLVDYVTKEPAGSIIIDTGNTYLYFVLGDNKAVRYGIGVGREGFTWSGRERISRMTEWPDWYPPADMIERQPYLPRMMAGGPGNPLGARALYLGKTLYRIHGTNQPSTIGKFVSSGCIRMLNDDVVDLYGRIQIGTRVTVLPGRPPKAVSAEAPAANGAVGQPLVITSEPLPDDDPVEAPPPAAAPRR
jgi:lipoprotein-anchoring transpeptidase ErfK/SrfK